MVHLHEWITEQAYVCGTGPEAGDYRRPQKQTQNDDKETHMNKHRCKMAKTETWNNLTTQNSLQMKKIRLTMTPGPKLWKTDTKQRDAKE